MAKSEKLPRVRDAICSERLKVVADPTRLAVLRLLLTQGTQTVAEIQRRLHVEQSLLSHHLQVLRDAGMVKGMRRGKSVLYALSAAASVRVQAHAIDLGCCEIAFRR